MPFWHEDEQKEWMRQSMDSSNEQKGFSIVHYKFSDYNWVVR